MEKTATMNIRVNPSVKQQAEDVLSKLGVPMATAIDMYLKQISLNGGIPFPVALPKVPHGINADTMTDNELQGKLKRGYDDIELGNTQSAAEAFAKFKEERS
jgi:addiction module RelB/DinJ family antitoxin